MTEQLGFSVLSAPLAALDRRALSQAWYSALHLASGSSPSRGEQSPKTSATSATTIRANRAEPVQRASGNAQAPAPAPKMLRHNLLARATSGEADRRMRSPLARKIEGAFLHPSKPLARATFTIGDTWRVHIALQNNGFGMRLVAVCAPAARAAVAKALDEARYALAARGISIGVALSDGTDVD